MLRHLIDTVASFFTPQWVYRFPLAARIEREINLIGRKFGLPEFKINKANQIDGTGSAEIDISVLAFLRGYRQRILIKDDPFILTVAALSLRFLLWREYLDISFRFLLKTRALWVEVNGYKFSLRVKVFPDRLDNYIYLFLTKVDDGYMLEIGSQEEGNGGLSGRDIVKPVRLMYNTWSDAIEMLVRLMKEVSMSKPEEAKAMVERLSAIHQV
jgi:hypothetical protein